MGWGSWGGFVLMIETCIDILVLRRLLNSIKCMVDLKEMTCLFNFCTFPVKDT